MIAVVARPSLIIASRLSFARHTPSAFYGRSFSAGTPPARATESNDELINAMKANPVFAKVASSPKLLKSIKEIGELMQRNGEYLL